MTDLEGLMTLKEACERVFRGAITPASLRAEASRGKLRITRIGRRDFVTRADLEAMVEACAVKKTPPAPKPLALRMSEEERSRAVKAALAIARAHIDRVRSEEIERRRARIAKP